MRKMEFVKPGVLSKDRAWKRVYVILNGTSLRIFKHNPRSHTVKPSSKGKGPEEYTPGGKNSDGVVSTEDLVIGAPHVHLPEDVLKSVMNTSGVPLRKTPSRSSSGSGGVSGSGASRRSLDDVGRSSRRSLEVVRRSAQRSSMSSSSNNTSSASSTTITTPSSRSSNIDLADSSNDEFGKTSPNGTNAIASVFGAHRATNSQSNHPHAGSHILATLQSNQVLRHYSLQNAETGLASDYLKRKNVIRVRADGEQFLIQADNVLMAIDWIETFQAGANVALDLDTRPMPKVPALPRRRRRRRPTTQGDGAQPPAESRPEAANHARPHAPPPIR